MSNIIRADHDPAAEDVVMGNGMTSVFLSVLLLSGSDLASADPEVATVAWLADQDQATVGLGVVGFDVADLGWTRENFDQQKQFLLRVVDAAMARHRWDALSYRPSDELLEYLAAFRALIARFPIDACTSQPWGEVWSTAGLRTDRAQCPRHGVYLNSLCSDDAECCLIYLDPNGRQSRDRRLSFIGPSRSCYRPTRFSGLMVVRPHGLALANPWRGTVFVPSKCVSRPGQAVTTGWD